MLALVKPYRIDLNNQKPMACRYLRGWLLAVFKLGVFWYFPYALNP